MFLPFFEVNNALVEGLSILGHGIVLLLQERLLNIRNGGKVIRANKLAKFLMSEVKLCGFCLQTGKESFFLADDAPIFCENPCNLQQKSFQMPSGLTCRLSRQTKFSSRSDSYFYFLFEMFATLLG